MMSSSNTTAAPPSSRTGQTCVLVIDDSPEDMALLTEYLRGARLRIAVAFDGREGYQKATVMLPELILMDVRMPRTDGFAACRLLKADPRTRDIPVIFLSGCNELDDRLQGLRLGAVDYISKPFAPEEVMARVHIHLDLRRRVLTAPAAEDGNAGTPESESSEYSTPVRAAMAILLHDIGRPPSLPELAHQVGTNERRLTELFREATGMPVFAWLREERFLVACRLLAESALDIQQIADHVGYGSAGNFTTMFRDRLGVTPRDYRQAQRERRNGTE
ncbi:MAG: response regulator [Moraxellaceae bacterium]|nr:response regulator [Moraxellaceae bacterium]